MRNVDELNEAFVNAETDAERESLKREMAALNAEIAQEHLAEGNISEYQSFIR
jgi:hypothetical protein